MKKLILLLNLITFSFSALANNTFDCERFLNRSAEELPPKYQMAMYGPVKPNTDVIDATIQRFKNTDLDLEDVLAWIAVLLGEERASFVFEVDEHLDETRIIRNPAMAKELAKVKDSVRYGAKLLDKNAVEDLTFLFDAIRTAFSAGIGDAHQWNHSTIVESFHYAEQFRFRATRILLFQYKLYRKLLALSGATDPEVKEGPLTLVREFKLPIPGRKPIRIFAPQQTKTLFDTVSLRFSLFRDLQGLGDQSDKSLTDAINAYVDRSYIQMLDTYFRKNPGYAKKLSFSFVGFMALGSAALFFPHSPVLPFILGSQQSFENLQPDQEVKKGPLVDPQPEQMIKQIEEQSKNRPLSEMEKVVLETLKRSLTQTTLAK